MKIPTEQIAALHVERTSINSQDMETMQVSINHWMDKEVAVLYTMKYYSAIKKQRDPTICDNTDGP